MATRSQKHHTLIYSFSWSFMLDPGCSWTQSSHNKQCNDVGSGLIHMSSKLNSATLSHFGCQVWLARFATNAQHSYQASESCTSNVHCVACHFCDGWSCETIKGPDVLRTHCNEDTKGRKCERLATWTNCNPSTVPMELACSARHGYPKEYTISLASMHLPFSVDLEQWHVVQWCKCS